MAEFLHQKASGLWCYRRRFPKAVAAQIGKTHFLKSLGTYHKREAEQLSRAVSLQFDAACAEALQAAQSREAPGQKGQCEPSREVAQPEPQEPHSGHPAQPTGTTPSMTPAEVLASLPARVMRAAEWVVQEQQRDPAGWQHTVLQARGLYESQTVRPLGFPGPSTAVEARAYVRGIDAVLNGEPIPEPIRSAVPAGTATEGREAPQGVSPGQAQGSQQTGSAPAWGALKREALALYQHAVTPGRYRIAERVLSEMKIPAGEACTVTSLQEALRQHCQSRLEQVHPRTVRTQLDAAVAALRKVLPEFKAPTIRALKGVMRPTVGDREAMPVQRIREAIAALEAKPKGRKVREAYAGGASQFDAIAVQALAYLGMRPKELLSAGPSALVTKRDVFGGAGWYFRVRSGKNKASERDIPLSDGTRDVLDLDRLRAMLAWQEHNPRDVGSAVTSLTKRFKGVQPAGAHRYTVYQLRHSWKDIAQHTGVDFELRERLLGHTVPGIAAVYGSGIPLAKGLDALLRIKQEIQGVQPAGAAGCPAGAVH